MSRLSALCKSLDDQKNNYTTYCQIISQFLQNNHLNQESIDDLSQDPYLDSFISHLYILISHVPFPSPSNGIIPPHCIQALQFFIQAGSSNPDILAKIASHCPGNNIPQLLLSVLYKIL